MNVRLKLRLSHIHLRIWCNKMPKYKKMANNSPDNFQTDPKALDCLVPYLSKRWNIWEPACGNGNLVRGLEERGFNVQGTDILQGSDFLVDKNFNKAFFRAINCIVTNPPYGEKLKEKFMTRCYTLGKPFALLMPLTTFDSRERRQLMDQYGVKLIMPNGRINFETPNHEKNIKQGKKTSSWFYTCWFTWGLDIGKQIFFSDPKLLDI